MGKCWTCLRSVNGYHYTCSFCENFAPWKSWRKTLESVPGVGSEAGLQLQRILHEAAFSLAGNASDEPAAIAAVIEWGFEDIRWDLWLKTNAAERPDQGLRPALPSQADQWRETAEELRRRRLSEEAEKLFLKALEANLMDYRNYLGLAMTYLGGHQFDKAKSILERSITHAPTDGERIYSYRLLGHLGECDGDYAQAAAVLRPAIEFSPNPAAHYDYARYCAQTGNTQACLSSLKKTVFADSLYWYLAHAEQAFQTIEAEVRALLEDTQVQAAQAAADAISRTQAAMKEAKDAIAQAKEAQTIAHGRSVLLATSIYDHANLALGDAKLKLQRQDYAGFLEAKTSAEHAAQIAGRSRIQAGIDREHYRRKLELRSTYIWRIAPRTIGLWALVGAPTGGIVGTVVAILWQPGVPNEVARGGFIVGAPLGMLAGIGYALWVVYKNLR